MVNHCPQPLADRQIASHSGGAAPNVSGASTGSGPQLAEAFATQFMRQGGVDSGVAEAMTELGEHGGGYALFCQG